MSGPFVLTVDKADNRWWRNSDIAHKKAEECVGRKGRMNTTLSQFA